MKFIVDELPYSYDRCPFDELNICKYFDDLSVCPMRWGKYKRREDNPRECVYMMEAERWLEQR